MGIFQPKKQVLVKWRSLVSEQEVMQLGWLACKTPLQHKQFASSRKLSGRWGSRIAQKILTQELNRWQKTSRFVYGLLLAFTEPLHMFRLFSDSS